MFGTLLLFVCPLLFNGAYLVYFNHPNVGKFVDFVFISYLCLKVNL